MRLKRWNFVTWVVAVCWLVFPTGVVVAQPTDQEDRAAIEKKSKVFMEEFGAQHHVANYRRLGQRAQEIMSEEAFVAQSSILRQQVGGEGGGRRAIDFQRSQRMPGPNGIVYGEFSFVRFATRYPVGQVYEDIYLEKEADDEWRVVGWWLIPAPG